ncbi:MAG: NADP-dependent malic enzyme, partial [Chlamydiia bacterium]|nr:NADP-dependent malic enzyme [Chlamydiia bacterium]
MNYQELSLRLHARMIGKIGTISKFPLESIDDLSVAYTPGVAAPCQQIAADPSQAWKLTSKGNTVAVVSDGSAVLGLGNIGPLAAIPVMEGKAILFRHCAGVDAWPLCLDTQDTEEIIETIRRIAPCFGAVNLEDISAPRCFEIEDRLQDLGIPVFHDDQHGTAIVAAAALINACRVTGKDYSDLRVVISGAGAAGVAIARTLTAHGAVDSERVKDVIVCDSKGAIASDRDDLNSVKRSLLAFTNREGRTGTLREVLRGADVFIGVSKGGLLSGNDIAQMAKDSIVLALANPDPEILPDEAKAAGAAVVGTGRSDFPNQVNNVLAFPGIFRGALDAGATQITPEMKQAAARALAGLVQEPTADRILPTPVWDPEI